MKNVFAVLFTLVMSFSATAGEWTTSYLQGYNIYHLPLDDGNASVGNIELDCADDPEKLPSFYARLNRDTPVADFTVFVDKGTLDSMGYSFTNNYLDKNFEFKDFYNAIRKAKTIEVTSTVDGVSQARSAKFEKNGEEVLPAVDSAEFVCHAPARDEVHSTPAVVEEPVATQVVAEPVAQTITYNDIEIETYIKTTTMGAMEINVGHLVLTSKLDDVTIKYLTINRGTCTVAGSTLKRAPLNRRLGFAQSMDISLSCDNVLEFIVHTNRGDLAFEKS